MCIVCTHLKTVFREDLFDTFMTIKCMHRKTKFITIMCYCEVSTLRYNCNCSSSLVLSTFCCIISQFRLRDKFPGNLFIGSWALSNPTALETLHHMSVVSPLVEELEVGCDLNGPGQVIIILSYLLRGIFMGSKFRSVPSPADSCFKFCSVHFTQENTPIIMYISCKNSCFDRLRNY